MLAKKWVGDNYENIREWLTNITKGEKPYLVEDFIQEIIIAFLEHKNADEIVEKGAGKFYIIRIGMNNWNSSTSPFHKKFRKEKSVEFDINKPIIDEEYDDEQDILTNKLFDCIDELLNGNNKERYYGMIILLYSSMGNNFSEVARRLNVSRSHISTQYKKGVSILLEKLNDRIDDKTKYNGKSLKIITSNILKNYGKYK